MDFVILDQPEPSISRITLRRGKVNAINAQVIAELQQALAHLEADKETRAIILTGHGAFFSFGLDVPELVPLSPEEFSQFLEQFTSLYGRIFACEKPVIAAVNGHATAGGCMLVCACDHRAMATGKAKLGLNEVRFGAGLFATIGGILHYQFGGRTTDLLCQQGALHTADQAAALGVVDVACDGADVEERAIALAQPYLQCHAEALKQIRKATRGVLVADSREAEQASIRSFVELWYSPETRAQVEQIVIRAQ